MSEIKHKGSKVVYLRRSSMSVPEATGQNDPELKPYFDAAYRAVASYWEKGSMRPGTGLTIAEENLLLPYILNIPAEDRDFRQRATDFFHEITTKVEPTLPSGDGGTRLEIGLENPELALGEIYEVGGRKERNMPLNVGDYVRWRHALRHPNVATSEMLAKGDARKFFYIYDTVVENKNALNTSDKKDEALEAYLGLKTNLAKVKEYLLVLNQNPATLKGKEAITLRGIAETRPVDFLKVHNSPTRAAKALIIQLMEAKIIYTAGSRYLITDNDFQIGADLKETIAYLRDPAQSKQLAIFKGALQTWQKKNNIADVAEEEGNTPPDTQE